MSVRELKKNASRPDAAEGFYVPYSAEELAESRGQRKFLNAVNVLNARLWMCVHIAECACEAIRAGDHYRAYTYFRTLVSALEDHYNMTALLLSSKIENCRPEPKPANAADVKTAADFATDRIVAAIETSSAQVVKSVRKKPGKKRKYPDELVRDVCAIWEEAQKRPKVKASSNKRTCYEAGFDYARNRLRALGVNTVAEFKSVIGANSDRKSRLNRRR